MHTSVLVAALLAGAHCTTAMPLNAAFGHHDSLVHRHARAHLTTPVEHASMLTRFLRVFGDHHLEHDNKKQRALHQKHGKRSEEVIKTRPRGIGMTLTHLQEGDPVYDESIFADAGIDDLPYNIKRRDISHRGMGEPATASVEQVTPTGIAELGPGIEKLASTASMASPTAASSILEDIVTQLPTLTTTLTLVPTLETQYKTRRPFGKSGSASPTPFTTRIVYVDETPAASLSASGSSASASTLNWVQASQVKVPGASATTSIPVLSPMASAE